MVVDLSEEQVIVKSVITMIEISLTDFTLNLKKL